MVEIFFMAKMFGVHTENTILKLKLFYYCIICFVFSYLQSTGWMENGVRRLFVSKTHFHWNRVNKFIYNLPSHKIWEIIFYFEFD